MKKNWNQPVMEELSIKQTAGGSAKPTEHDGVYATYDGQYWEGYLSGKKESE